MKKLNFYAIPLIIFLSFALFIGGSMLTGYWQTERSASPKVIQAGSFHGQYDPYDIRGSYTIAEVLEFYPITKEEFYTGLGLPASLPTSTQLKEFETLIINDEHLGVSDVRDLVAYKMGLINEIPSTSDHETTEIIEVVANSAETDINHTERSTTTPTGGTTLAQVYQWGISQEMLETQFQISLTKLGVTSETTLKELSDQIGVKMYDLKEFITSKM